jgi:hypothetical protein
MTVFGPFEDPVRLLTASTDGSARLWRPRESLPIEALQERLREASTACLTARERQLFLDDLPGSAWTTFAACERAQGRKPPETPP